MVALLVVTGTLACTELTQQRQSAQQPVVQSTGPIETGLNPAADTYIRSGAPNQNEGTEAYLRLQSSGHNRALIRFDPEAIRSAVGTGTLQAARLELTISLNANNWGTAGRAIDLHRLTQAWTELGATWNCAVDANPSNSSPDCSGATAWEMGGSGPNPWIATPTATATITNGQSGVVTLDVSADVLPLISGAGGGAEYGWILKKTQEGQAGHVELGTRESSTPPRLLLLTTATQSWPLLTNTLPDLDTTRLVALSTGPNPAYLYRTEFSLHFKEGISDSVKAAFFSRNSIVVVGVTRGGTFFVRVPDPGPSLQSYYAAMDWLAAQPEVETVGVLNRTPNPPIDLTRFPSDGFDLARADWLTNSSSTWAFRAIRAPMAWGCETGAYEDEVAKVGLFEWKHKPTHPEFLSSSPQLRQPSDSQLKAYEPVSISLAIQREAHAVATTGLLSAAGDNGRGIAGVMWRSQLHLYSGYSQENRPLPLASGFYLVADAIVSDQLGILSLSADGRQLDGVSPDATQQSIVDFAKGLRVDLFDRLPSLLVVVAAGNDGFRGSVADYVRTPGATILLGSLLWLSQDPAYRDRILVVGGTQEGGYLWDDGNLFTSAIDIAAPASDVRILDRWPGGGSVPLITNSGTSLAAPLVAGVAGLLRSMDPTLTAAQVKDYILRGARVRRIDPATGDSVPATPVIGAPETIYQLDAYGALALLSQERPGTPICGFPVAVRGGSIVLERPARTETLAGPGGQLYSPSLAQGGRLIAVADELGVVSEIDYRGIVRNTLGSQVLERRYLERDTVDVLYSVAPEGGFRPLFQYLPSRPGLPTEYNPWPIAVSSAPNAVYAASFWEFSPTGDSIALHTISPAGVSGSGNNVIRFGWDLVSVPTGTSTQIRAWMVEGTGQYCASECVEHTLSQARWSHGGLRLVLLSLGTDREVDSGGIPISPAQLRVAGSKTRAFNDITQYRTSVVLRFPGGEATAEIEGKWFLHPRFTPDDAVLVQREASFFSGVCESTARLFADFLLWRKASPAPEEECDPFDPWFALPRVREDSQVPSITPNARRRPSWQSLASPRERQRVMEYLRRRPTRVWLN